MKTPQVEALPGVTPLGLSEQAIRHDPTGRACALAGRDGITNPEACTACLTSTACGHSFPTTQQREVHDTECCHPGDDLCREYGEHTSELSVVTLALSVALVETPTGRAWEDPVVLRLIQTVRAAMEQAYPTKEH